MHKRRHDRLSGSPDDLGCKSSATNPYTLEKLLAEYASQLCFQFEDCRNAAWVWSLYLFQEVVSKAHSQGWMVLAEAGSQRSQQGDSGESAFDSRQQTPHQVVLVFLPRKPPNCLCNLHDSQAYNAYHQDLYSFSGSEFISVNTSASFASFRN